MPFRRFRRRVLGTVALLGLASLAPFVAACEDSNRPSNTNTPARKSADGGAGGGGGGRPASALGKAKGSAERVQDRVDDHNRDIEKAADAIGKD